MGNHTSKAKLFIEDLQERKRFLQILSDFVFSELQKDFFLEEIYSEALLKLLPVRIPALCDFMNTDVNQLKFLVDNKFVYRTESLVVSCSHGNFPFSAFLPNEPSILQQWILEAQKIGIIKQEEKRKWIIEQFENRINAWDTNDKRRTCTSSLVNITIDDIKYLSKKAKHKA
jgi:hypothetical protein